MELGNFAISTSAFGAGHHTSTLGRVQCNLYWACSEGKFANTIASESAVLQNCHLLHVTTRWR